MYGPAGGRYAIHIATATAIITMPIVSAIKAAASQGPTATRSVVPVITRL
jgi:hypothetical protein